MEQFFASPVTQHFHTKTEKRTCSVRGEHHPAPPKRFCDPDVVELDPKRTYLFIYFFLSSSDY